MKHKLEYTITNIHTNDRMPGVIYASVLDASGSLCVSATIEYCVEWIKANTTEKDLNKFSL